MRLKISSLSRVYNRDLPIEFGTEKLTSYGGLELVSRFFRRIELNRRIRAAFAGMPLGGDYRCEHVVRIIVGLLLVGGRRLEHLQYVATDPLYRRFCGLLRIPSERTVVRWLKRFTRRWLGAFVRLNSSVVLDQVEKLRLSRATIDLDGTVLRTGNQVPWAVRGYNPHHPKDPSYYPILAHLAQTGQILRVKNRPGNVVDSTGAVPFITEIVGAIRARFGRSLPIEFRLDAAFFKEKILKVLSRLDCEYAVKVPFWSWLGLKQLVAAQERWTRVLPGIEAFEAELPIEKWGLRLRVVVYRKRVHHRSPKNFQLDLFSPDDGYFEYSAVTTNKSLRPRALWDFMAGRGAQEKTFGELKSEFALDVIPTNHYGANSVWQQLCVFAHNLIRAFQLDSALATEKRRSLKRTYAYRILSMKTLRFLLVTRAGRLARIEGRNVLRLADNPATKRLYDRLSNGLAA